MKHVTLNHSIMFEYQIQGIRLELNMTPKVVQAFFSRKDIETLFANPIYENAPEIDYSFPNDIFEIISNEYNRIKLEKFHWEFFGYKGLDLMWEINSYPEENRIYCSILYSSTNKETINVTIN